MERREIILYIFSCLSDSEFRRKVWVDGEYFDTYCSSFGEAVNSLDDFNFFNDVENGNIKLENNVLQIRLEKLMKDILDYQEPDSAACMLKDPSWIKIVDEASQIHALLNSVQW